MYNFPSGIEFIDKIKATTLKRAVAMVKAAKIVGNLSVEPLLPIEVHQYTTVNVAIKGIIDSQERLGPFFDRVRDIVADRLDKHVCTPSPDILTEIDLTPDHPSLVPVEL